MRISRPKSPSLLVLSIILICVSVSHAYWTITLPGLGRQLGFSDVRTGYLVGLTAFLFTLASIYWGRKSEVIGRSKVVLSGVLIASIALLLSALAIEGKLFAWYGVQTAFLMLLGLRFVNAWFTGGIKPASQAYIADCTSQKKRMIGMGLLGATYGIGTLIGGFVVMRLGTQGVVAGLYGVGVLLALATVLAWWALPESLKKTEAQEFIAPKWRTFTPWLFMTLLALVCFSMLQQLLVLRLQDQFGLAPHLAMQQSGKIMMSTMAVMIVTQMALVRVLNVSPAHLLVLGSLLGCLSLSAMAFSQSIATFWVTMIGFGLASGLIFPANLAQLSLNAGPHHQSKVAGVNGVMQGIGLAIGPIVGPYLYQLGPQTPYLAAASLALVMTLVAIWSLTQTISRHSRGHFMDPSNT